ncbi:MAG TPA: hypothetical protein VMW46_11535, partial [Candidatus Desulfaltia sp.]|nr:hypothetical protein [Candidatus Desulfaltia sp.]
KEQERREKLKGKNVKVITNADLKTVKRTPAVTTSAAPPAEAEAAEPPEQEYLDAREAERAYDEGGGSLFATGILPDTLMVENPEFALYPPDGKFAEIPFGGFLDLELRAKNGPGNDIAIYARRSGTEGGAALEDGIPVGAEGSALPSALQYGVLVWGDTGDWEAIGQGMGINRPERFDLGNISSITGIRIVFRAFGNASADLRADYYSLTPQGFSMGIDAVESLH